MKNINIVITTFNRGKLLFNAVESCEPLKDVANIMVFFDTLKDPNYDKLIKMNIPWIKIYKKKNGGLSSVRNAAIKKITKGWITFLDDDDWLHKNFIEWSLKNNNKLEKPIYQFNLLAVSESGSKPKYKYPMSRKKISNQDIFVANSASTYLINKNFLEGDSEWFYEGISSEDAFFTGKIVQKYKEEKFKPALHKDVFTISYNGFDDGRTRIVYEAKKGWFVKWESAFKKLKKRNKRFEIARFYITIINNFTRLKKEDKEEIRKYFNMYWSFLRTKKFAIFRSLPIADKLTRFPKIFRKNL